LIFIFKSNALRLFIIVLLIIYYLLLYYYLLFIIYYLLLYYLFHCKFNVVLFQNYKNLKIMHILYI